MILTPRLKNTKKATQVNKMSYIQVKCECGGKAMIYIREDRVFRSGETIGKNACDLCGSRVEASLQLEITKPRKELK